MATLSTAILAMENEFLSWLFNYAPINAIVVIVAWLALRLGTSFGKYEERFASYEERFVRLEAGQKELTEKVNDLGSRLGRLEAQTEIIIDLLKQKK